MRCPQCGRVNLIDINFFKENMYFCKKCDTVSLIVVTELSNMRLAIIKAYISEEKKRNKNNAKEIKTKT